MWKLTNPKFLESRNLSEWDELNQIDLAKMFEETSPRYFIPHCRLNRYNKIQNPKIGTNNRRTVQSALKCHES